MRRFIFSLLLIVPFLSSCGEKEKLIQTQSSGTFVQEYNPEYLDVLWVIDDRSTLYPIRSQLVAEAQAFFQRLEGLRQSYRMAFITSDMQFAKGKLKPASSPVILERHIGDANSYASYFGATLSQVVVNLGTGAEPRAFEASTIALTNSFQPRAGVPLIVIYISDSEDRSVLPAGVTDAVEYYSKELLKLKGNDARLLKVYSINYTATGDRCTGSQYDADIDKKNPDGSSSYQDRFFKLAKKLGGETADICKGFSSLISLEGIRLKSLPTRFKLEKPAKPESVTVILTLPNGSNVTVPYHYEAATNEIVFDQVPPEGARIQVSFLPL